MANGNEVTGFISGNLGRGAYLADSVIGQAVCINGNLQYADSGNHQGECYHNPDVCNNDVIFSLWIYTRAPSEYINADGFTMDSVGYSISMDRGLMTVAVNDEPVQIS